MSQPSVPPSPAPATPPAPRPALGWILMLVTLVAVFALGVLGATILERRHEAQAQNPMPLTPIAKGEPDSAKWGANFPREYGSYLRMGETTGKTKYGGATQRDYLADDPSVAVLFAGFAFSKDYRQPRGHVFAIEDVTHTKRVNDNTVATCWTCKSPDVPRLMAEMGGPDKFYALKFKDLAPQITHPIGCADCHEANTMRLIITRPALIEAFKRQGRDITQVSHQEMRSLVCAQCHVTYYFKKEGNYLTFPWDKGTKIEQIADYYTETGFSDWTHAISKTPMVKTRHPDYETYSAGVHAYRNVACADCHMPYRSEGGVKLTDHHLQSPLLNISNSCAVCHRWGEDEIRTRVEGIQDKVKHGREVAEADLTRAHFDIAACMQAGASDAELAPVRELVRQAQLRWDFVASGNGMGFHAPQECQRMLGDAGSLAQEARVACTRLLARHGFTGEVQYPDFSTKDKAQALNALFVAKTPPDLLGTGVFAPPPAAAVPASTAPAAPAAK